VPKHSIRGLIPALAVIALALASPAAAEVTSGPAGGGSNAPAFAAAYAAFRHIPADDVAGVRAGSVHTGRDASTGTQWATASFFPSGRASSAVLAGFQDGGSAGVFARRAGTGWTMTGYAGQPLVCSAAVPAPVRHSWGATTPECATSSPGSRQPGQIRPDAVNALTIANVANSNVGVGDTPASTDFSFDCNPFTTLVDAGVSSSGCGTDPRYHVLNENEEWCSDFAKYVWEQGGVTADLGTINGQSATFYQWALDQGQHPSFGSGTPQVGDAVVFYPSGDSAPNSTYADHVGLITQVNPDGTLNLDNGDFAGGSNITVQANDNVSLGPWSSSIWGSGEHWIFVSPGVTPATAYPFWEGNGPADDLWQAQGPASGNLGSPADLGMGPLGSAPAAGVAGNDATYVYWRGNGPQYDLWEAYWNGSKWVGPYNRGMGPMGSPPSVAVTGGGTAYVFWKGDNGDLWEAQGPANGTLSGPYDRGMGPLGSQPSVGVDAAGSTYVYWEGTAPQDELWEAYWNGSKFAGPYDRGMGPLGSQPSVAVTGGGTAYVFWKGQNGDLYQAQGPANGSLSGPANLGMGPLGSAPSAGVDINGYTYVYWEGTAPKDELWEGFWNGSKWVGPYDRGDGPLNSPPTVAIYPG
jgi:hypothetical protein